MASIAELSSGELTRLYQRRTLSPVEVASDVLARIEAQRAINAFLPIHAESVIAAARASEDRWRRNAPQGPVDGLLASIKDNIWVQGLPTRKGSLTSDPAPALVDAPAVARLREQGAIVIGKTAMPEHGWIGICRSPLSGVTRNPWNPAFTPGGSTGGGAAAALLNLGTLHLGTDGAGSLRIPAAFTGVVGMKPSFGRVPVYPPSPLATLSHQGPVARTVGDAALMLSVIGAPDPRDMAAWNGAATDFRARLEQGVRNLRIAWSPRLGHVDVLDPEIEQAVGAAVAVLESQGARVEQTDPELRRAGELIRILWWMVAASIVDSVPQAERIRMDPGFLQIATWGRRYTANDYLAAQQARAELYLSMLDFHQRYDLLVTPTMPVDAIAIDSERPAGDGFGDDWLSWSPYTYPFNLTQQPAASVPCGLTSRGLPIGLQIVGAPRGDVVVLRAARALERALPFPKLEDRQ
jgi:aspartyl-tRNA(Asn)/glutamyl-tRNA(Gln) amidotransferase subunit A